MSYLRGIPLIAALALRPHLKREELRMGLGYLDFALLLTGWTFVYAFFVLPWMYISYSDAVYNYAYNVLNTLQQLVVIVGFGVFWLRTRNAWRTVYAYLFSASALYMLSSLATNVAISRHDYYTGSLYDLPLLTVFFVYGMAGFAAFQRRKELDLPSDGSVAGETEGSTRGNAWAARLAMGAVLSLPLFALYAMHLEHDARAIRDFRLTVTLVAAVPLVLLGATPPTLLSGAMSQDNVLFTSHTLNKAMPAPGGPLGPGPAHQRARRRRIRGTTEERGASSPASHRAPAPPASTAATRARR